MRPIDRWMLIGLAVIVIGSLGWMGWAMFHPSSQMRAPAVAPAPAQSPEELRRAWIAGVTSTLAFYDNGGSAAEARDALLSLRVPGADRDIHLQLVLAFQALADHTAKAEAMLKSARAAFEKISL